LTLLLSHLLDCHRRATHHAARHRLSLFIDGCLLVASLLVHNKSTMPSGLQALHTPVTACQQLPLILYLPCHQWHCRL